MLGLSKECFAVLNKLSQCSVQIFIHILCRCTNHVYEFARKVGLFVPLHVYHYLNNSGKDDLYTKGFNFGTRIAVDFRQ
jgi:hypothetical protein